jgi:hypothetical protein
MHSASRRKCSMSSLLLVRSLYHEILSHGSTCNCRGLHTRCTAYGLGPAPWSGTNCHSAAPGWQLACGCGSIPQRGMGLQSLPLIVFTAIL